MNKIDGIYVQQKNTITASNFTLLKKNEYIVAGNAHQFPAHFRMPSINNGDSFQKKE